MSANLSRLQQRLAERELPAMLISDMSNIQWATGFTGSFAFLIVRPADALFISDSRYTVQAKEQVKDAEIQTFASPVNGADFLAEHIKRLGIQKLGFESQNVTYATYAQWKEKLAPTELIPVSDFVEPLRLVKTADEIEKIRRACALADNCFDHVVRLIQAGVSEYDIGLDIEFFFRRQGADLAFPPIVVSGERSARPHGRASEKKLEHGDFVTLDFGAKLDGYNSDITRTVVVEDAGERHRQVYNAVLRAQTAALEAMKPGVRTADVDKLSRQVLAEDDLDKFFGHGLGHGLGSVVHDGGRMNSTSETILAPGQVWTVEPGVYIEGFGGVRIEDDVVVTDDGIEILTHSPKALMVLPRHG